MPNMFDEFSQGMLAAEMGVFEWPKSSADGAAATATPETSIGLIGPGALNIDLASVQIHPGAALAANATNYATITVYKRTAANPGSPVQIATLTTATSSWTAFQSVPMTLSAGAFLSPGDCITVAITKAGTGVVVPQLYLAGFVGVH